MKSGVEGFVIFEGKVLLLLRDDIPTIQNPNMWNLPGGGIEDGETEEEALVRELEEEIGIVPQTFKRLEKTSYPDGNVVTRYLLFITPEEKQKLKLGEGQKMKFFSLDGIMDLPIIPNLRRYLQLHKEKIAKLIQNT
jgi:8-oxo-dGTP diphosphatase